MKIKISAFLLALVLPAIICQLSSSNSSAQIFGGGATIVGSSNAPILLNFNQQTNTAYSSLPSRTLMIGNLVSNETVTVSYAYQWAGWGNSNLYALNTFTTNFNGAGLTNGSTVLIPLPGFQNFVPVQPWGSFQATNAAGNVTNTVQLN